MNIMFLTHYNRTHLVSKVYSLLGGPQVGCATFSPRVCLDSIKLKLDGDKGLKSACSQLMLGEMGVTLTVTPPEFIVAAGKGKKFCASWVHLGRVHRIIFLMLVNTNGSHLKTCVMMYGPTVVTLYFCLILLFPNEH